MNAFNVQDFVKFLDVESASFFEMRKLNGGQAFYSPGDQIKISKTEDHFYGVMPRIRKSGTANDISLGRVAWLDIDLKNSAYIQLGQNVLEMTTGELTSSIDSMYDDFKARCEDLRITPGLVLASGHGIQALFKIEAAFDPLKIEQINAWLASEFCGDPCVFNRSRILRMPGSINFKNRNRPIATRVLASDFSFVNKSNLFRFKSPNSAEKCVEESDRSILLEKWVDLQNASNDKGRHFLALAIAGWLKSNDFSQAAAVDFTISLAKDAKDPEIRDRHRAVIDTYQRSASTNGWRSLKEDFALKLTGIKYEAGSSKIPASDIENLEPEAMIAKLSGQCLKKSISELAELAAAYFFSCGMPVKFIDEWQSWALWKDGHYELISSAEIRNLLDRFLSSILLPDFTNVKLDQICDKLARLPKVARKNEDGGDYKINCSNGILNLDLATLEPHSMDIVMLGRSDVFFDSSARCPHFIKFIESALPAEYSRIILQEWFGYALTRSTRYQKAMLLIGESGTGKGVTHFILDKLLGKFGTSIGLELLKDGTPALGQLIGARMCAASEIIKNVDWATFKRITGEDPITINQKYKDPFRTTLHTKILIMSNVMPNLGEDVSNNSITRRFLQIRYDIRPKAYDSALRNRLSTQTELSGILNWAIEGLSRLLKNDGFTQPTDNFSEISMLRESNKCFDFIDDCCMLGENFCSTTNEVYAAYKIWALDSGYRPLNRKNFTTGLNRAAEMLGMLLSKRRDAMGDRRAILLGIKLRSSEVFR